MPKLSQDKLGKKVHVRNAPGMRMSDLSDQTLVQIHTSPLTQGVSLCCNSFFNGFSKISVLILKQIVELIYFKSIKKTVGE